MKASSWLAWVAWVKLIGWHKCTLPKCSIVRFLHWFLEIHCLLSMSINYEQERYIFIYSLASQVLELGEVHVYEKKFFLSPNHPFS